MLIFTEGGKLENPEKNPRSKGENQQQTQLTYDTDSGNGPEREASTHTATPPMIPILSLLINCSFLLKSNCVNLITFVIYYIRK
jgi:hypothetical protein